MVFQLRELIPLYGLLKAHIPGFVLALPVYFKNTPHPNTDGFTQKTLWVIETDPCGRGDFACEYAEIDQVNKNNTNPLLQISLNASCASLLMTANLHFARRIARLITKVIDPAEFNEAFLAFHKIVNPKEDLGKGFNPMLWFETFTF